MPNIYVGRRDRAHLSFRRHPQFGWLLVQCCDADGVLRVERSISFHSDQDGDMCYQLGNATIYANDSHDEAKYNAKWSSELVFRLLSDERACRVDAQLH